MACSGTVYWNIRESKIKLTRAVTLDPHTAKHMKLQLLYFVIWKRDYLVCGVYPEIFILLFRIPRAMLQWERIIEEYRVNKANHKSWYCQWDWLLSRNKDQRLCSQWGPPGDNAICQHSASIGSEVALCRFLSHPSAEGFPPMRNSQTTWHL
jgi:hypothetical protein